MTESRATLPDGRVLTATCELIEVTSLSDRPDPAWRFVDAAGHEHTYVDQTYPTLVWVVDQEDYVVIEDGYPEEYPGEGHYECGECGEVVTPAQIGPSPYREFVPGVVSYFLDDEPITEDEYRAIVEQLASR